MSRLALHRERGATTTWERWDALDENGRFYKGGGADMVSFNHYAYGSIGAFFYRRILGIEAVEAGFSSVRIAPVIGGTLTHAEGSLQTPHGKVSVSWRRDFDKLHLEIAVPGGRFCQDHTAGRTDTHGLRR